MGGPKADAGQKLGWVCNFLPHITEAGSFYLGLLAPGPEPLKASTSWVRPLSSIDQLQKQAGLFSVATLGRTNKRGPVASESVSGVPM